MTMTMTMMLMLMMIPLLSSNLVTCHVRTHDSRVKSYVMLCQQQTSTDPDRLSTALSPTLVVSADSVLFSVRFSTIHFLVLKHPISTPLRSMSLVLHPDLAAHIQQQGVRLPKRTLLYEYRLNCDYASMLWAREFLFNVSEGSDTWHTHLRIDSSPQFNKNFLVGELDRICTKEASADNVDMVFLGLVLLCYVSEIFVSRRYFSSRNS